LTQNTRDVTDIADASAEMMQDCAANGYWAAFKVSMKSFLCVKKGLSPFISKTFAADKTTISQ
jgi:hypothetical protein